LIDDLDAIRRIRYPDNVIAEGAAMHLEWGQSSASISNDTPTYRVNVPSIDQFVKRLFEVCSRNPVLFTPGLNAYARDALTQRNPVSDFLFETEAAAKNIE
jgi:hypothetical protein